MKPPPTWAATGVIVAEADRHEVKAKHAARWTELCETPHHSRDDGSGGTG
jgi:hypothetical protein